MPDLQDAMDQRWPQTAFTPLLWSVVPPDVREAEMEAPPERLDAYTLFVYGRSDGQGNLRTRQSALAYLEGVRTQRHLPVWIVQRVAYVLDPVSVALSPRGEVQGQEWGYVTGTFVRSQGGIDGH